MPADSIPRFASRSSRCIFSGEASAEARWADRAECGAGSETGDIGAGVKLRGAEAPRQRKRTECKNGREGGKLNRLEFSGPANMLGLPNEKTV
jgi:hypothetical protein